MLWRCACSQLTSNKLDENGSAMEWDLRRGCQDNGGGARRRKKELKMCPMKWPVEITCRKKGLEKAECREGILSNFIKHSLNGLGLELLHQGDKTNLSNFFRLEASFAGEPVAETANETVDQAVLQF